MSNQRKAKAQTQKNGGLYEKVEKIERSLIKQDARHAWIKSNNMKQATICLQEFRILSAEVVGGSSAISQKCFLNANSFQTVIAGVQTSILPQTAIWDEYAAMYEFYMVERIELEYVPTFLQVETTTTGIQDTAVYPTVASHVPDSLNVSLWNPVVNFTDLTTQMRILSTKKGARIAAPRSTVQLSSVVSNTILLKQDTPMLRTNASAGAREQYLDEAGGIVILPARAPTDRIPFGYVKFKIWYRFAGQVIPGLGKPVAPPQETTFSSSDLRKMLEQQMVSEAIESASQIGCKP